jgi:acetyl esterase/lipase
MASAQVSVCIGFMERALKDIKTPLEALGLALVIDDSLSSTNIRLWAGAAPQSGGAEITDQPMLSVHLAEAGNGCGVIVCPGGGYRSLASDHEGLQVAHWLNAQGIHAFVLRYRLGTKYHSRISLLDGLRAMRLIRYHANELQIDPARLGMLGFSAGGHLALAVATHASPAGKKVLSTDPIDDVSSRPDFVVPVYAVTNGAVRGRKADEYLPTDTAVTANTPPAFIVHTHQDSVVPASQSTLLYDALLKAGVAAELHIFNQGDHGLGLAVDDPDTGLWPKLLMGWLRRHCFFTDKKRLAISGQLLVEGGPLGIASIILVPKNEDQPHAYTRLTSAGKGAFAIPASRGPVRGRYEVKVHLLSNQYPPATTGRYTLAQPLVYQCSVDLDEGVEKKMILSIEASKLFVSWAVA